MHENQPPIEILKANCRDDPGGPRTDVAVSTIQASYYLWSKLAHIGVSAQAEIWINPKHENSFDYDPTNEISPTGYDLESILMHETMHALGFYSVLDTKISSTSSVSLLDLFRISKSTGTQITTQLFSNTNRDLKPADQSMFVAQTSNASHLYDMSQGLKAFLGDGNGGSHWKDKNLDPNKYFGSMNPTQSPGGNVDDTGIKLCNRNYIFESDLRALDLIGWDINHSPVPPVEQPQLQNPPADQLDVPVTPNLSWAPSSGASTYNVFVYNGPLTGSEDYVYSQRDVTGTSIAVPPGKLSGSTIYTWVVSAQNAYGGIAVSEPRSFQTQYVPDATGHWSDRFDHYYYSGQGVAGCPAWPVSDKQVL